MEREKKINIMLGLQIALLICVGAIITSVLCLHPCFNNEHHVHSEGLNGDHIQQSVTKVWRDDAVERILKSYNTFTIDNSAIRVQAERIKSTAIKAVTGNGTKELEELLYDCGNLSAGKDTLGAIEMFYGIVDGNFKLFYKPVVFCAQPDPRYGQGGHYYKRYNRIAIGDTFYVYNPISKSFVVVADPTDVSDAITSYKTAIRIKRPANNSPIPTDRFVSNATHDIYNDVTSVIMPVDEFTLMAKSSTEICLWSAMEPLSLIEKNNQGDEMERELVKHIIILSSGNVTEDYNSGSMYYYTSSKFSDMSHLCPPSCNADQFTFALKEVP